MSLVFFVTSSNKFVKSLSGIVFSILLSYALTSRAESEDQPDRSPARVYIKNKKTRAKTTDHESGAVSGSELIEQPADSDKNTSDEDGPAKNNFKGSAVHSTRLRGASKRKTSMKYENRLSEENVILMSAGCGGVIRFESASIMDEHHLVLPCSSNGWQKNDIVLLRPRLTEVAGILQIESVQTNETKLKMLSVKSDRLIQKSDFFEKIDLSTNVPDFYGTSYLWKSKSLPEDSRVLYRPLVTQGSTIGETAQTLWQNEFFFDALGTLGYGISDHFTLGTNLAGWALGSPNGRIKGQVYQSESQTWSLSLSSAQERNSSEKLINIDLIWDSILSDKMIAHSLVSAAVISFNSAKDAAVLKSYGSSSIQTGYEYILNDWSRFLAGPSYNIDQKAIGGYLGYVKIINNLHLQASLTTNNIRELKLSAREGYFFILDAYWRW